MGEEGWKATNSELLLQTMKIKFNQALWTAQISSLPDNTVGMQGQSLSWNCIWEDNNVTHPDLFPHLQTTLASNPCHAIYFNKGKIRPEFECTGENYVFLINLQNSDYLSESCSARNRTESLAQSRQVSYQLHI